MSSLLSSDSEGPGIGERELAPVAPSDDDNYTQRARAGS
jgi:hypothetical protein